MELKALSKNPVKTKKRFLHNLYKPSKDPNEKAFKLNNLDAKSKKFEAKLTFMSDKAIAEIENIAKIKS